MNLPEKVVENEEWRPINPDFVHGIVEDTYLVSNYGRVYNCKEERLLKPSATGNHLDVHLRINKDGKSKDITKPVHRLMLTAFDPVEGFENLEVDHIDNCSFNNMIDNLQWLTREENKKKEIESANSRSNITRRGGISFLDKCSEDAVKEACYLLSSTNMTYKEISEVTGISSYTVANIKNKKVFNDISDNYNFKGRRSSYGSSKSN